MIREICVESWSEAYSASRRGVERIELCENLSVGGTTPSMGTIKCCIENLPTKVIVMIRPRGGNFVYSNIELDIMREDIRLCKALGVTGVVFGALREDGTIDRVVTKQLVELASPMEITFHKAIDDTVDIIEETKFINSLGVTRILSSGGCATAEEGADVLNKMIEVVDERTTIVVAGKVVKDNLDYIQKIIPNSDYHGMRIIDLS